MEKVDFAFTEATLADCVAAAERCASGAADWHNHVLKPGCLFNPRPGAYALVIENSSTGEILVHFAAQNPVAEEQHIVALRHGAGILESAKPDAATTETRAEPVILSRIRELARAGTDWHHHMMFPACVLNPRPGSWLITLEAAGEPEILEYATAEEPFEVLREIEALFFAQATGE